ncbi:MAG: M20/M25/M40 family metallo-hydrolase [Saprospiraceae bacterium]|nr:M20/M25/M40 family metallo-hydrolase [Saprospiraceae bacterium]
MNRYKFLFFILLVFVTNILLAQKSKSEALQGLRVDVVYLASDLLGGRETGTEGEKLAAQYIASRFEKLGLKPAGSNGTWYQSFDFKYNPNPHSTSGGEDRSGKNVLGYLDNGAKTTIIIGAHYDHLGHGGSSSLAANDKSIHNGADDNASGIAALLHIAEYLKTSGKAKNNNYLFMGFSGEELGLVGSKFFVENATIDLANINYMLNMDMVGRLNAEKVLSINGVGTSPLWKEALDKIKAGDIKMVTTESGVGPSDHTSFYFVDKPVLHFFTGQHTDYHKPGDDSEKINYEGLLDVSNFIITLIENLDAKGKLAFTKTKDESQNRRAADFKVTLGVMPDYVHSGEGMRVDGVLDGRPGAKAGLQKGDIIIQMGEYQVKDVYGYMEGLSKFKAGDKTKVKVKRGNEVVEVDVVF